jgi:hypothetical protein
VEDAVYRAALLACEFEGDWQLAAELINELEAHGVPLETAHFDMALRACDRASRWQEALALFERLSSNLGLRPSARSFECVLRTCAKGKQSGIVLKLWDMLRDEQQRQPPLSVTPFTYNVLMRALAEHGNKGAGATRREDSSRRVVEAFNEARSSQPPTRNHYPCLQTLERRALARSCDSPWSFRLHSRSDTGN